MKVSIVGSAGRVGSSTAYAILLRDLAVDELLLQDIVDSVQGEAMDLTQAAAALKRPIKIGATTDVAECAGSDVIIIAAGLSLSKAHTFDRSQMAERNWEIVKGILEKTNLSPKTKYIIATNPVDGLTYLAAKAVGDRSRVLGASTITDTGRLDACEGGYLIGEHGGHMVYLGGNCDIELVKQRGVDVVASKGGSWFLTPIGITSILAAIINDEKREYPVSVRLEGEYELKDVALSVPCIVGRQGVEKVLRKPLDASQQGVIRLAAESVRSAAARAER